MIVGSVSVALESHQIVDAVLRGAWQPIAPKEEVKRLWPGLGRKKREM